MNKMRDLNPGLFTHHSLTPQGSELLGVRSPTPAYQGPWRGHSPPLGPGSPSLPELREAGLKTADPSGFVLGTKASAPGLVVNG